MGISDYFKEFLTRFSERHKSPFYSDAFTDIVVKNIPDLIIKNIDVDTYTVKGSVGQGNWAETPWVAILNSKISDSTTHGYYVCYLLDVKAGAVYICLAVGWTQFSEKYTYKLAVERISVYSKYLFNQLRTRPDGFQPGRIDLSATGQLTKGYESGQILSKRYTLENMPNEQVLLRDLKNIIATYDELTLLAGSDLENIDYGKVEQNEPLGKSDKLLNQITLEPNLDQIKLQLDKMVQTEPPAQREVIMKKAVRNPKIARLIKESALYICELCGKEPFMQKNGKFYAEADHVRPLGESGFDSPDNMRCLCAQCHAVVTHGSDDEVRRLISA